MKDRDGQRGIWIDIPYVQFDSLASGVNLVFLALLQASIIGVEGVDQDVILDIWPG